MSSILTVMENFKLTNDQIAYNYGAFSQGVFVQIKRTYITYYIIIIIIVRSIATFLILLLPTSYYGNIKYYLYLLRIRLHDRFERITKQYNRWWNLSIDYIIGGILKLPVSYRCFYFLFYDIRFSKMKCLILIVSSLVGNIIIICIFLKKFRLING